MTREDRPKLNDALNLILIFITGNIPEGWEIRIDATQGDCSMSLENPDGDTVSSDFDAEQMTIEYMVNHAREAEGMERL